MDIFETLKPLSIWAVVHNSAGDVSIHGRSGMTYANALEYAKTVSSWSNWVDIIILAQKVK